MIAGLVCLIGILLCVPNRVQAQGPVQPEAMQFEPVDVTDVVNLATGDFTYAVPLIEVPGPEGGYPLALSYHSRIGPNQPATWVGLGWSLNPGAVNRTVSGYPDDYFDDAVVTKRTGQLSSWSMSIGAGYGSVGLNMNYDHHSGMIGANLLLSPSFGFESVKGLGIGGSLSVGTSGVGFRANASYTGASGLGISASGGTNGFSMTGSMRQSYSGPMTSTLSVTAGTQGISGNMSANTFRKNSEGETVRGAGFSLSSTGSMNLGRGDAQASAGFSSTAGPSGAGSFSSSGFSLKVPIPVPGDAWISFGFSQWTWELDERVAERSNGFVNRDRVDAYTMKYERQKSGEVLYASPDAYQVSAQGISGSFQPYWDRTNQLFDDFAGNDPDGQAKGMITRMGTQNDSLYFRFSGDAGVNFASYDRETGQYVDPLIDPEYRFGRRIIPTLDEESGRIRAFKIVDTDGKTYVFERGVYNMLKYTESVVRTDRNIKTTNTMKSPYATSWMLTAITGPDYVDRDVVTGPSDNDWGYWVKFDYTSSEYPSLWRSPYEGTSPGVNPSVDVEMFSFGAREHVVLSRIETPTHLAEFESDLADDRRNAQMPDGADLDMIRRAERDAGVVYFRFPGNLRPMLTRDGVSGRTILTAQTWSYVDGTLQVPGDDTQPRQVLTPGPSYSFRLESPGATTNRIKRDEVSYNPLTNETTIAVPDTLAFGDTGSYSFADGSIKLTELVDLFTGPAAKLDRITLYAKADEAVTKGQDGVYQIADAAKTVKSAEFTYDYSLARNQPASKGDKGKLTLNQVVIRGLNGAQTLPPYEFEYAYDHEVGRQLDLNPDFHIDNYDRWGSYRRPDGDSSPFNRRTPQDPDRADAAASWSLTSILKPTGGRVDIRYESDDYYYVADVHDPGHMVKYAIDDANATAGLFAFEADTVDVSHFYLGENVLFVQTLSPCNELEPANGSTGTCSAGPLSSFHEQIWTEITDVNPSASTVAIADPLGADSLNSEREIRGYLMKSPRRVYGGGTRVAEVRSTDGQNMYRTVYEYTNGSGYSSGVASSLPNAKGGATLSGSFNGPSFDGLDDDVGSLYLSHDLAYGRPAPGVLYSSVDVISKTQGGAPLAGKTRHEFYTANDHPYVVDADSSTGMYEIDIVDRSAIYGKPKSNTVFEFIGNDGSGEPQFRPLKRNVSMYAFSDEIAQHGALYDSTGADIGNGLLGATSERQYFENNYTDASGFERTVEGVVTRRTHNAYPTGSRVIEYDYDNRTQTLAPREVEKITRTLGWDARTGVAIANASVRSDGGVSLSKTSPAYWFYDGMRERNMLTQPHISATYLTDALTLSDTSDFSESVLDDASTRVLGAEVTTWSSQFAQDLLDGSGSSPTLWLKNSTYMLVPNLVPAGSGEVYFPTTDERSGVYDQRIAPRPTQTFPWKRAKDISRYDQYGRAIESLAADGSYSSVLYGYDKDALVVATASKAAYDQVRYFDFEGPAPSDCFSYESHQDDAEAHTGQHANRAEVLDWQNKCEFTLPAGEYDLSYWAKQGTAAASTEAGVALTQFVADSANVFIDTRQELISGGWHRYGGTFELTEETTLTMFLIAGGGASGHEPSKYHWLDQVRIHPVDSRMSTFTYDPITWKVTSITDANGVSSFFEYDEAGRLIAARDQDRHLTGTQRYAVARMQFLRSGSARGFSPRVLNLNKTIQVNAAETSMSPYRDDWTCQWAFEGEQRVADRCDEVQTFRPEAEGETSLSLDVFDPSGRRAASATRSFTVIPPEIVIGTPTVSACPTCLTAVLEYDISGGSGDLDYSSSPNPITGGETETPGTYQIEISCPGQDVIDVTLTVEDRLYPSIRAEKVTTVSCDGT